jgi:hypothetical protein
MTHVSCSERNKLKIETSILSKFSTFQNFQLKHERIIFIICVWLIVKSMARRRNRRTPRKTRRNKTFNIASALEAGLIGNALTQGFFNVSIGEFVMSTAPMQNSQITARELISGLSGGSFGTMTKQSVGQFGTAVSGGTFGQTVKSNLQANAGGMIASLILIPAGFKVFNKLSSKPRGLTNKALKMSGLPLRV